MVQFIISLVRSIRPRQTLKNLSLLAPLIFSGQLFIGKYFLTIIWAIVIFTIATSSLYLLNDIIDLPRDRLHPLKKQRPIASGKLPIPAALFIAILGFSLSLSLSFSLGFFFFFILLAYLLIQISYTFWLKNIIIFDVLIIAGGFILRVYAGAFAINVHMNVWFLLCVVSLALFLAVGKRRAELAFLQETAPQHRQTLSFYSNDLLDAYLSMFANATWLVYALFTFFSPPPLVGTSLLLAKLPLTIAGINKWLMATIPFVIYGIMRYMSIVYQGEKAESPEKVLLSDKPHLTTVILWALLVVFILYGVRA
ncbi:UbiA prenyltransferase family protein [Patescibacteria group bacterium]|nr:UbiA prenyltransferase family protein [Patescibacteria group bacterium]